MDSYAGLLTRPTACKRKHPLSIDRTSSKPILFGLLILAVLFLAGSALIYGYLERERQRDLEQWEIRLTLVADSRVEAIRRQLNTELAGLTELANNASLQLYLSQLALPTEETGTEPAQLSYLRNLILAAAQREGLTDNSSGINANLPQSAHNGLALVDHNGRRVTATPFMPPLRAVHHAALEQALASGRGTIIDLHQDEGGVAVLGFVVPVQSIQGAEKNSASGALIAVRRADQYLYPLLRSAATLTEQDETLLVERRDGQVQYLSPLSDGSPPLQRSLDTRNANFAGTIATETPGRFARASDYRGRDVLMISRPVPDTPWILIQQTGYESALKEARQHRRFLLTSFSLLLFFTIAALVAAWRHGSSVRAQHTAAELLRKTRKLDARTQLLHGITDHIDAFTALLNPQHELVFANTPLARAVGISVTDMRGKRLASVIGPDAAQKLITRLETGPLQETHSASLSLEIGGHSGIYQCAFIPLAPRQHGQAARLLVLHDITELQQAQQRHSELMRKLVGALMHVVDLHDPHSGHHSARVSEVANALGAAMGLDDSDRRVLDLAANLANLGKIFVPREILTKSSPLTDAEQDIVRRHVQYSVDILKDLEFEGPVLNTIAQKQELMDGSGYPHGLKGEELLLTARILAVANAFVALMSSRAYRGATSVQQALDALLQEADSKYDRRVVAALFHVAENQQVNWSEWDAEN